MTMTCPSHDGPAPMPIVTAGTAARDLGGHGLRHRLDDDRVSARARQRARVLEQAGALRVAAPLHLEAAELGARTAALRPMWPMTGMPAVTRRCTSSATATPPLELHGLGAALLQEAPRGAHAVLERRLVAHERQIGDDVRAPPPRRARRCACDRTTRRASRGSVVAWPCTTMPTLVADEDRVIPASSRGAPNTTS